MRAISRRSPFLLVLPLTLSLCLSDSHQRPQSDAVILLQFGLSEHEDDYPRQVPSPISSTPAATVAANEKAVPVNATRPSWGETAPDVASHNITGAGAWREQAAPCKLCRIQRSSADAETGVGRPSDIKDTRESDLEHILEEMDTVFDVLMKAGHRGSHRVMKHRWHRHEHRRPTGVVHFFRSVAFFDWCLLAIFMISFFLVYWRMLKSRVLEKIHGIALLIWLSFAVIYGVIIFFRQHRDSAILWACGYIMEFIFLVENVFVFHIVMTSFSMPSLSQTNTLFYVVCCQIAFQAIFYMGLAQYLTEWEVLPYILGVWLLYVGYHAAMNDDHGDFDIMESRIVRLFKRVLGERFSVDDNNAGAMLVKNEATNKTCLTVAGLCLVCLMLADFLLEIDVTLAKIEGLGGDSIGPELEYLCFSSSAMATFTIPELYFVARDLFARFAGLKYGIALVITYLGIQMLLGCVYSVPIVVDIAIFIGVLIASALVSVLIEQARGVMQSKKLPKTFDMKHQLEIGHGENQG